VDGNQGHESEDRDADRSDSELAHPNTKSLIPNSQFAIPNSQFGTPYVPQGAIPNSPFVISCPFCGGSNVELFSLFGSQLLTSEYYCRNCRTVFENLKG
jgi:hypothetical protein